MCKKLKPENVLTAVFVAVLVLVVVFAATAVHGTEVARRRDYHSDRSIERIVSGLGLGALHRGLDTQDFGDLLTPENVERIKDLVGMLRERAGPGKRDLGLENLSLVRGPTFYVDGERATIWQAAFRVLLYALDLKEDGQVQWAYVLKYRYVQGGYYRWLTINRWTIIQNDYVHGITILPQPMARMSWARLDTHARENGSGTNIRNVLTISTPYGNRCGLVRRIVYRKAVPPMDNALYRIENEALSLFEQGRTSPIARSFAKWYLSRAGIR
jgi:hypothetical protein